MAENILHFGAIRFRVNGSGNLDLTLLGYDDASGSILVPLAMKTSPGNEPLRLCNFTAQRARLRISVDKLNEYFIINRLVFFVKDYSAEYPG